MFKFIESYFSSYQGEIITFKENDEDTKEKFIKCLINELNYDEFSDNLFDENVYIIVDDGDSNEFDNIVPYFFKYYIFRRVDNSYNYFVAINVDGEMFYKQTLNYKFALNELLDVKYLFNYGISIIFSDNTEFNVLISESGDIIEVVNIESGLAKKFYDYVLGMEESKMKSFLLDVFYKESIVFLRERTKDFLE